MGSRQGLAAGLQLPQLRLVGGHEIAAEHLVEVFLRFLGDVTDPFLNLFRRLLPPLSLGGAAFDLSPIIAVFVLRIVGTLIVNAISG